MYVLYNIFHNIIHAFLFIWFYRVP